MKNICLFYKTKLFFVRIYYFNYRRTNEKHYKNNVVGNGYANQCKGKCAIGYC